MVRKADANKKAQHNGKTNKQINIFSIFKIDRRCCRVSRRELIHSGLRSRIYDIKNLTIHDEVVQNMKTMIAYRASQNDATKYST